MVLHDATEPSDVGLNAVDLDGHTPLHYAIFQGHPDVVTLLLRRGAHPAMANVMGLTPLYIAASLGHAAIVDQLRPEQPAKAVSTPLHGAAKYGRVALFHKPQLRPFLMDPDESGNTALHLAASAVDAPSVRALLSLGADIHRRNEEGNTPLHGALAWLERQVQNAENDNTRASVRKNVGRRLRGAATGQLERRGQAGTAIDLAGVPVRVCRKLEDFPAVVLCFLAAGAHVGWLVGGGGSGGGGTLGHRGARRLCLRIIRGADGYGPRQFARLAITGRTQPAAAEDEQQPPPSGLARRTRFLGGRRPSGLPPA